MAWLTGWHKRKQITLSRATGAVTNYQMKLLVGESAGATGEDVDCGGKCLSTFNDLRFTAADGTTLLPYWIESITGTTPNQLATVWIKFDSIGVGATTFYMYYENSGAAAVSNGKNSFQYFEDFEWATAGNQDIERSTNISWSHLYAQHGQTCTTKWGGSYGAYLGQALGVGCVPRFTAILSDNIACNVRLLRLPNSIIHLAFYKNVSGTYKWITLYINTDDKLYYNDNSGSYKVSDTTYAVSVYFKIEVKNINWSAGTYDIYMNDGLVQTAATMGASGSADNLIELSVYTTPTVMFDNVIVRNYASTEPAWGAWGAEEAITIEETIGESASISDVMAPDHLMEVVPESAVISDAFVGQSLNETIRESAGISDLMKGSDLYEAVSESVSIDDVMARVYEVTRATSESASITDAIEGIPYKYESISESLVLVDTNQFAFSFTLTEVLFVWEAIRHGWKVSIDESLVLEDSQAIVLGLLISDWITLIDSQTNNWNGRDTINDSVYLYDLADKYFRIADTVNESVELADTTTYKLTIAVLEYLGFTELATAMRSTAATVNESLALTETQSYAWALLIQEALSVVDTATVIATFVDVVQESVAIADAASLINRLGLSLNESLVFTETVTSKGTLYNAVYDTLKMSVTVELGGEVYECYVLNTPKFMPSMYSGFNFNSYCVFENRAFGANDTGIYELTGTTDAGSTIHTGAILSQTDFGARNEKRFRRAYLGISGSAPVMVFETEEGARQVYNINSEGKTVISHELKSRKWKLSIADFDELDTMKLIPVILSK